MGVPTWGRAVRTRATARTVARLGGRTRRPAAAGGRTAGAARGTDAARHDRTGRPQERTHGPADVPGEGHPGPARRRS
jgi:hypothetical protein